MIFFDSGYFLFVLIPALILSGLAQMAVRGAYNKWSQRANSSNITGADVARRFTRNYGFDVSLEGVNQDLGDHFDPRSKVVRLSPRVARDPSIASMAIAAHEYGHVQQYANGSILIQARGLILPVAQYGSYLSYIFILAGLLLSFAGLAWIGLGLFFFTTLFSVLTLPIEIDASRRAMKMLEENNLLTTREDRAGAQAVLRGAALTYLAAMAVSILNFAYYAMLVAGINRD
ncbi:MAG: zinc metallopeptidase [Chloroflexi bacterium]|nr:zinc metallopeptidase [Chloroflexota bacterium]